MKLRTLIKRALLGIAAAGALAAASPALATVQYNSDNSSTGFDATTASSLPAGWTSNSGAWAVGVPSTTYPGSVALISSHIHGLADSTKTSGDVATLTGIAAITDADVTATEVGTVNSTDANVGVIYVGINGNSGATQGYLLGVQQTATGSSTLSAFIFKKTAAATYTKEATSSAAVATLPSTTANATFTIHLRIWKVGSTVYGKVWLDGTAEPSAASVSWVDTGTVLAAGQPWLYELPNGSYGAGATDFVVNDNPYGEANSLSLLTPAALTSAPYALSGAFSGTAPTGLAYALDGATSYTTVATPTIGSSTYSFALPASIGNGYHQVSVEATNATTEAASGAASAYSQVASAYTLTGPAALQKGTAATFTLANNGTTSSADTVTIGDGGAGGTFNPTSPVIPANSTGSSSVTVTYTPATTGSVTISAPSDSLGLTAPGGLNYTVTQAALTIGNLLLTPSATSISVGLSAPLAGGNSSTSSTYSVYRGTDPNFTEGAGTLIYSGSATPYVDSSVVAGTPYYYGVSGTDGTTTVVATPLGYTTSTATFSSTTAFYSSAALNTTDVNLIFDGDSITYDALTANPGTTASPNITYFATARLKKLLGLRTVNPFNGGCSGSTVANWLKTAATDCQSVNQYNYADANNGTSGAALAHATDPGALMVFNEMLGTNDSNQNYSAGTYTTNWETRITSLLTDWPSGIVILHDPSYYTPNTYAAGSASLSLFYSYRSANLAIVAYFSTRNPGHVFLGDTYGFSYFAQNYATELTAQVGYGPPSFGTVYLHPNATGSQSEGEFWATADAQALYAAVPSLGLQHFGGFH